ncbi:MAG TPA: hypothetical protein VII02_08925 [Gemmatimonadaceae bacterium]
MERKDNPEGFPWGNNRPIRKQRVIVATLIALVAGGVIFMRVLQFHQERTDFSQALFGARALLNHGDPYKLVGPGLVYDSKWPLMYPATAFVAAIPLSPLADRFAAAIFVAVCSFALAYGVTARSWHLLPMFASAAFLTSVQLAQWSVLMTAMLFIPWLAVFAAVKPQAALPVLLPSLSSAYLKAAAIGAVALLAVSLLLLPQWPAEWWSLVRGAQQFRAPIARPGGVVISLVLLRWRRREAWLVFLMALVPQSWAWYNVLMLLAIPVTYREACVLSVVSSIGAIAAAYFAVGGTPREFDSTWGQAMVAFAYLPATIAVLRRPNIREAIAAWSSNSRGEPNEA